MWKKSLMTVGSLIFLLLSSAAAALAQATGAEEYKFEAGAQFTVLNSSVPRTFDFTNVQCITTPCTPSVVTISSSRETQPGFGARIGYRVTAHLTLEAEVNLFPGADSFKVPPAFSGGHKIEGLFGVKAGKRFRRAGVFAKIRPGFLYASRGDLREIQQAACIAVFPPPAGCFETTSTNSFALDLGGVLEFYPTRRTIIRFDAGDTILHLDDRRVSGTISDPPVVGFSNVPVVVRVASEKTHNFQGTLGIGFRF